MTIYHIHPERRTLHGYFSRDLEPVLTIVSGDVVHYQTLDAGWHFIEQDLPLSNPKEAKQFEREDIIRDSGHALVGPIAIEGAKAGMVLEIYLRKIRPARWGWSFAGEESAALGILDEPPYDVVWNIDPDNLIAWNEWGDRLRLRPFMGVMGLAPSDEGNHPTRPPRFCGGNIDCKDLVEGTRLFLPIAVDGALFSIGDGHAVQGDGEVSGVAIECPMELVEVEFHLHENMHLKMPRAETDTAWITFGFHEDLDEAWIIALDSMLDLMQEKYGFNRKRAMNLASLVVDLHITQVVNFTKGVHAVLPYDAIQREDL